MSDKIDILVKKYAREYGATGDKYYSSAENFAKYLEQFEIKAPIEIWHKYTLPDNMTSIDFFNLLRRLDFLMNHEKLGMPVTKSKALTLAHSNATLQSEELVKKIKELNPELKSFVIKPDLQIDFLDGVNFGFPPEDIAYFLGQSEQDSETRRRDFDMRSQKEKVLMNLIGKIPNWIIAPQRMERLVQGINSQCLLKAKNKKSHHVVIPQTDNER